MEKINTEIRIEIIRHDKIMDDKEKLSTTISTDEYNEMPLYKALNVAESRVKANLKYKEEAQKQKEEILKSTEKQIQKLKERLEEIEKPAKTEKDLDFDLLAKKDRIKKDLEEKIRFSEHVF